MEQDFSPEERLLYLIKGAKAQQASGPVQDEKVPAPESEAVPPAKPDVQVPEPEAIPVARENDLAQAYVLDSVKQPEAARPDPGRLDEKRDYRKPRKDKPALAVKDVLLVFFVAFILFGGYIAFDAFVNKDNEEVESIKSLISSISDSEKYLAEIPAVETKSEQAKQVSAGSASSLADYKKVIESKPVFALPASRAEQRPAIETLTERDILKEFKLVGIMPGDPPQAIIEDIKNKQTLFLKEGEKIDSIQVRQILAGRVMLGYNEEIITLSL
jgi:hypothetical protein